MGIDSILQRFTLTVLKGYIYLLMLVQQTSEKPVILFAADAHKKKQVLVAGIGIF